MDKLNYAKHEVHCPVCRHDVAFVKSQYNSNGIMGSGHSSYITDQYYICEKCGVHFNVVVDAKIETE